MSAHPYAFNRNAKRSLVINAEEAVNRIYGAGICLRSGEIGPGTNNVMADEAARSWTKQELDDLRKNGGQYGAGFANVIALRQKFAEMSEKDRSWGKPKAHQLSREIFNEVYFLRRRGWKPSLTPAEIG